jgi:dihydroorotase-like cyclic amidohydrolase
MPCVDEVARDFQLNRAAGCEFHIAHWTHPEAHFISGTKIRIYRCYN